MKRSSVAAWLLVAAAVSFAMASAIHFGLMIRLGVLTISDPFFGAAIPEAVLALVVAAAALHLFSSRIPHLAISAGAAAFAIIVTLYGLSVTLGGGRTADVMYHVAVLAILLAAVVLMLSGRFHAAKPAPTLDR